nr:hypothetical protein [Ruminococcus sp.]
MFNVEESRRSIADPSEAMVDALCKSTSSILSSGLTTVIVLCDDDIVIQNFLYLHRKPSLYQKSNTYTLPYRYTVNPDSVVLPAYPVTNQKY